MTTTLAPPGIARCASCGVRIFWARGANGRAMPIDALPHPSGNIWIDDEGNAHVRAKGEEAPAGKDRFVSHFSTCEFANQHRRQSS